MTQQHTDSATLPLMPDFSHGFYGFRHTLDSALKVLEVLQVPKARINVQVTGVGSTPRWIAQQTPPPGTPLFEDTRITLHVAGRGFCRHLPVAMWHKGDEEGLGTTEIFELLDDPLQKALYWIREGARLFDISASNPDACARWISLFGLNSEQWPVSHLYPVASLLPSLARLAGTENGVRLALDVVLQLPLSGMRPLQAYRYLEEDDLSLLGTRANRLSLDYILSDRFEDAGSFELIIGPVDLESYYEFKEPEGNALLQQTLRLVMPSYSRWSVSWVVADPTQYPRLGIARQNSLLGLNSYLGPLEKLSAAVS